MTTHMLPIDASYFKPPLGGEDWRVAEMLSVADTAPEAEVILGELAKARPDLMVHFGELLEQVSQTIRQRFGEEWASKVIGWYQSAYNQRRVG